ncbi:uncharacterized protein LOC143527376 [Brachyhypopomus gauderio]|uniref:uncharacterized protein LOC143527376 n=1 Tax=Brachyhypopomus gauderio TaxID=698409 RepID=UPI0040427E49
MIGWFHRRGPISSQNRHPLHGQKTLTSICHPKPVAEMETSRVVLTTLVCIVFSSQRRISGVEVELRVRRGDNATLYCDCKISSRASTTWFRNCSHDHQPPLIILKTPLLTDHQRSSRFHFVYNVSTHSHNLVVEKVTEQDLGWYYCAKHIKKLLVDQAQPDIRSDFHFGAQITRLSLIETTTPTPLSVCCWTLLVTVCPVCVLLSSTCLYCLCHKRCAGSKKRNENIFQVSCVEEHQCEWSVNGEICYHTEISYTPLRSTLKSD